MSLLSQFGHRAPDGAARVVHVGPPVDVAPPPAPVLGASAVRAGGRVVEHAGAARRLGRALLATHDVGEHDLARLEAAADERVQVWTPSLVLRSRFDLMSTLTNADDAIAEIDVVFTEAIATSSRALLEWLATGRFTGPAFLDDDELVEPTGAVIRIGGALSLSFTDGARVARIHCYYDRLALIEQLLYPSDRWAGSA